METATCVQILDVTHCITYSVNINGKSMHLRILQFRFAQMVGAVEYTDFFTAIG